MPSPRRLILLLVALLAAGAVGAPAAGAAAPEEWRALARQIADPWPALQNREGWYPDYIYGGGKAFCTRRTCRKGLGNARYGESLLGYGLIQTGLREGDQRLVDSGLRAISYIVAQPGLQQKLPTSFEGMAVASAYNLVKARQPDNPIFRDNLRSWEAFMKRQPVITTIFRKPDTPRYGNHFLIEALEIIELLRTGLDSDDPDAILGGRRGEALRVTKLLLNERVPGIARRARIDVQGVPTWVHSDPPDNPLAYFGLAPGVYARAVGELGGDAASRTRTPIRDAANASVWVSAPDGDMAYYGRSQEASWAPASMATATEAAANLPGVSATQAARYRAVTDRVLGRLRDAYGNGPQGLWVLPALRTDLAASLKGIDGYSGAAAFTGLTLVSLNWALDEMERAVSRESSTIGADGDSAEAFSKGESRTGVVRRGKVWFAVKRQSSSKRRGDLRYDFGLVALKHRAADGAWTDVLRLRPQTSVGSDSVGPILRRGGMEGLPRGGRLTVQSGTVTVAGGYRSGMRRFLRRGVRWTWRATGCGVRLSFPVRAGDRYEYSTFFVDDGTPPRARGAVVADEAQRVTFSREPLRTSLNGGYVSGLDPRLVRAKSIIQARRTGSMTIETCGV
ncbi:MAG: hypothetical protein ACR2ML_08645 [Solirubrobacteraceae bacterium]